MTCPAVPRARDNPAELSVLENPSAPINLGTGKYRVKTVHPHALEPGMDKSKP